MSYIYEIIGLLLKFIYESVTTIFPTEPASISYLAISTILIAIVFRILMFPLFLKSLKNQKMMAKYQGEINKIREKFKHDPMAMQKKLNEFNKEHGIKQLGGCLPMILQMILIFAMFGVMREPLYYIFGNSNAEVAKNFFWIKDLSLPDPLIYGLPLANAISQYFYFQVVNAEQQQAPGAPNMEMMKYIFPVVIFFSAKSFSAGLALYWVSSNIIEMILKIGYNAYSKAKEVEAKDGIK